MSRALPWVTGSSSSYQAVRARVAAQGPSALPSADYVALVFARSGLGIKHGIAPANCVGVIDSDYRGEILVGLQNSGDTDYTIQPGDRIAQLMLTPVIQASVTLVDELDDTARGAGGFGSTGT